jgi:trafficking protein particle complex subunit 13
MATARASPATSSLGVDASVAPTLRVMRLQRPEIHFSKALVGDLSNGSNLRHSLCLPDDLKVYVGETFTAYLGILNSSKDSPIRKLKVTAQLQTPTERYPLPSRLDPGTIGGGIDVSPESGVDAIVARKIEEAGQHILRVEVAYLTPEGGNKTFRKFYRFQTSDPLKVTERVVRVGDARCYVTIHVEYLKNDKEKQDPLIVSVDEFEAADGLSVAQVGTNSPLQKETTNGIPSAMDLLDASGMIVPGGSFRYMFSVEATSKEAQLRGIAGGDRIGRAAIQWMKAMGESGTIYSAPIHCPRANPVFDQVGPGGRLTCSNFVVHRSGLTVDVAAAANTGSDLINRFPVTIEPIDPPAKATLNVPIKVQFLIVNHTAQSINIQVNFAKSDMKGVVVHGPMSKVRVSKCLQNVATLTRHYHFEIKNIGEVTENGGSSVCLMSFVPLATGLFSVNGCALIDLASGLEIVQPPMFQILVENP